MKKTVLILTAVSAGLGAVLARACFKRCRKCQRKEEQENIQNTEPESVQNTEPETEAPADDEEAVTFAHLAMSLADDYTSVYYVNLDDNSYAEYSAEGCDRKLRVISSGSDFFADTQVNCRKLVFEEDQERFLQSFQREKLIEIVRGGGTFTLDYRLVIDGKPVYFNLKTCRALDLQSRYFVIGVRNVDAQIRRLMEIEEALGSAKDQAERDALTGVKNKAAYDCTEKALDEKIEAGTCEPFAVVVCDVNGLKHVNDTLGHQAGDEHLKASCAMICRVFKHSPVFRVGGDEFAVMLTGEDYRAREILTRQLREQMKFNQAEGRATVACGMAVFLPEKDKTVSTVFNRADAAMYRNKKQFSGQR